MLSPRCNFGALTLVAPFATLDAMPPARLTLATLLLPIVALLVACGGKTPIDDDSGSGGGTGGQGGSIGGDCLATGVCPDDLYCFEVSDEVCGPVRGECGVYPASCGESALQTVCGCDGLPHAQGACPGGVQVDTRDGACAPAPGRMNCGEGTCDVTAEFCFEEDTQIACNALPAQCVGVADPCGCLAEAGFVPCQCTNEPSGGARITICGI
jgi:hypothetical protein